MRRLRRVKLSTKQRALEDAKWDAEQKRDELLRITLAVIASQRPILSIDGVKLTPVEAASNIQQAIRRIHP